MFQRILRRGINMKNSDKTKEQLLKKINELQTKIKELEKTKNKQNEIQNELLLKNTAFESSIAANSISDSNGIIINANPAFLKIWDYDSMEEVIGKPISYFIKSEKEALGIVTALNETGEWEGEYTGLKKNGSTFIAYGLATVVQDDKGNNIGYYSAVIDVSEQQKAKIEMDQAISLMQYVIEHTNSAVAIHDKNLNYLYVSQNYLDQYKVKEKNIIGKYHYDIFPDLPQKWRDVHQRALAGEILSADDDPYEREDGSVDWTRWECRPWYEANGSIGGIIVYTEVITERKQAEEKIQHLNLILRTIRNVNQLIVEEKNRDVLIQKVCEILIKDRGYRNAWLVLLGEQGEYINSAEAGLGKNFIPMRKMLEEGTLTNCGYDTLKKKDLVIIKDPIKECLDCPLSTNYSGQSSYSICIKHGDNIYGLLSTSASKYYINDKEEQDLFKEVAGDIAFALHGIEMEKERKQAEEALKTSEEKMRLMIDNSPIGFSATDLKGNFIDVNPAVCKMTGYAREELIHRHFEEFSHPEDKEINEKIYKKLLENKISHFDLEKRYIHKDGSIVNVLIRSQIVRDEKGNPLFEMGITEDITKRKKAEQQIVRDLKEKTILLQELYHRTKNNMQVIISMLKIQSRNLENRSLTENEGIDYLHNSLYNVINKVKAMSLVHGKLYQAKDLSHINLKEYIEDLIRHLMISFGVRSEKVILKLELEDVFVLIDFAIPLGLVLNEMISNVFKHAFPHTKHDELFIKLYKEENETINIHLSDNGVGIPNDFDLKNVNTMGMQTVFSLTEYQLMGEVKYDTKKGLQWHISFKDNQHKKRV